MAVWQSAIFLKMAQFAIKNLSKLATFAGGLKFATQILILFRQPPSEWRYIPLYRGLSVRSFTPTAEHLIAVFGGLISIFGFLGGNYLRVM